VTDSIVRMPLQATRSLASFASISNKLHPTSTPPQRRWIKLTAARCRLETRKVLADAVDETCRPRMMLGGGYGYMKGKRPVLDRMGGDE